MVDMGIEPYLVSATVLGILAQRLVRVVCDACAVDVPPNRRGQGCDVCAGTGYRGRTGLYELMPLSETLRDRIVKEASLAELRTVAHAEGMASLRDAGFAKAREGVTTLEEVLRLTRDEVGE
jgi:general secretion pathway protein E